MGTEARSAAGRITAGTPAVADAALMRKMLDELVQER
jgi:hypothetical protein